MGGGLVGREIDIHSEQTPLVLIFAFRQGLRGGSRQWHQAQTCIGAEGRQRPLILVVL
jgi:hypothetical protein